MALDETVGLKIIKGNIQGSLGTDGKKSNMVALAMNIPKRILF